MYYMNLGGNLLMYYINHPIATVHLVVFPLSFSNFRTVKMMSNMNTCMVSNTQKSKKYTNYQSYSFLTI